MWSAVYLTCGGVPFALFPLASLTFPLYVVAWQSKQRQQKTFSSLLSRALSGQRLDVLSQYQQVSQSVWFLSNLKLSSLLFHPPFSLGRTFERKTEWKEGETERKQACKKERMSQSNGGKRGDEMREWTSVSFDMSGTWTLHLPPGSLFLLFFVASFLLSSSLSAPLFYPLSLYSFEFRLSSMWVPLPFESVKGKMLRLLAGINKVAAEYRGSTRTASIT